MHHKITRLKATAIHFGISFLIFLVLLYFILLHWYPQPLFSTDGGWRVIRIIVGVDLVLGPLLTLIVFKPGKPGLKLDMTLIAITQALALSWGVYSSYNERPAAIVFTVDAFTPVPAYQLKEQGIDEKALRQYGKEWPVFIYSNIPADKQFNAIREAAAKHLPLYLLTKYYTPFTKEHARQIKANSMEGFEEILAEKTEKPELVQRFRAAMARVKDKNKFAVVALHSRDGWFTALFDLEKMKITEVIDVEPTLYTFGQKIKRKKNP